MGFSSKQPHFVCHVHTPTDSHRRWSYSSEASSHTQTHALSRRHARTQFDSLESLYFDYLFSFLGARVDVLQRRRLCVQYARRTEDSKWSFSHVFRHFDNSRGYRRRCAYFLLLIITTHRRIRAESGKSGCATVALRQSSHRQSTRNLRIDYTIFNASVCSQAKVIFGLKLVRYVCEYAGVCVCVCQPIFRLPTKFSLVRLCKATGQETTREHTTERIETNRISTFPNLRCYYLPQTKRHTKRWNSTAKWMKTDETLALKYIEDLRNNFVFMCT